jgi:glycerol-3-phosphate acyltransferase PlsX
VKEALPLLPKNCHLHLFGSKEGAQSAIAAFPSLLISDTNEFIGMGENPLEAIISKPLNSINLGLRSLARKEIQAFTSAGHSGALGAAAMQIVGLLPGFSRPIVASFIPTTAGKAHLLLDVGANSDSKVENLVESAYLGSAFYKKSTGEKRPPVYLLNTGQEPSKGRRLHRTAYSLLQKNKDIRFCGNLEVRDLYTASAAVLVTDGYTGNIVLKQTEAFFQLAQTRQINDAFINTLNYENYGGSPLLGLKELVVLGHGASNATAIKNMILTSAALAEANS